MKPIIIPALAALALITAAPSLAAPADKGPHHDQRGGDQHKGPPPGGGTTQTDHHGPTIQTGPHGPSMQTDHHGPTIQTDHHRTTRMPPPQPKPKRYDWGHYQQGHTPPMMKHTPQLDFHVWQRNFNAPKHYHWQPYHRPNGWYYRRWVYGMVLPSLFWTQDYWINDYWDFDLPDPPYGYVWVRYGDDAMLVNVRTGFVLQVEYDLFD
jgi:hypothetical protein